MKIWFDHWRGFCLGSVFAVLACSTMSGAASASAYGSGGYDECQYQDCSVPQSTVVTMPASGLQININLVNGQVIPPQGYYILVAPANGQTTTIKQADFYIDGPLVNSQMVGEDGTVSWFWNPKLFPGTQIKITVTAQDGEVVTKQFQVTIGASPTKTTTPPVQQSNLAPPTPNIIQKTEQAIHHLPQVIKYSLPYFLFVLLSGDSLFLILQIRREVRESKYLQHLVDRERQSGELRKSFIQLVSHYLRTPFTIITGALDLLNTPSSQPIPAVSSLQTDVETLKTKIDKLVNDAASISGSSIETNGPIAVIQPIWRQPLLYLPILLVGIIAFLFDYLAQHSGSFSVGQISLLIQLIIFGSLMALGYLVIRRLQVHKRDTTIMQHVLNNEQSFNRSRDELIEETALELNGSLSNFDAHLVQLPISSATTLIKNGQQQLHDVIAKFVIAQQLKDSSGLSSVITTQLSTVCAPALDAVKSKAQKKGVGISLETDLTFQTSNTNLLSLVIQTILDNAIEYSPANDSIAIKAGASHKTIRVVISDHGPGIPEDKKYALFQAFAKIEGAMVFDHPGMGFSLYLDKLIMDYLHGDILIEANAPQGTSVTITLPMQPTKQVN